MGLAWPIGHQYQLNERLVRYGYMMDVISYASKIDESKIIQQIKYNKIYDIFYHCYINISPSDDNLTSNTKMKKRNHNIYIYIQSAFIAIR